MTQSLTRQQRRAATLDDPTFEGLRTPQRRALLSAALLGILALEAVTFTLAAAGFLPTAAFWAILAGLVVGLVIILGALKSSTRGIEELSPAVLDERQNQIRGTIYATAYRLVSWVFAATVLILMLVQLGPWEVPGVLPLIVAVISMQLVIIIPTLLTARHRTP
ncbi:hypothetical protein ACFP47_11600 [Nesterenkonia lacusekhoensis]|uniref:Membrane protein n=1 Tax=Nesterenkonia lacusekhoensis TaxID=150832 RepID=A0ABS4T3S8_9MICC|nr:hypothetical protein [Nesterenkonia lacusekhoensis]MBP2319117.1 putative membrane protein [Nesterenkonia lacusekhoensis]